jgi:hypothetical protein
MSVSRRDQVVSVDQRLVLRANAGWWSECEGERARPKSFGVRAAGNANSRAKWAAAIMTTIHPRATFTTYSSRPSPILDAVKLYR